MPDFKPLSELSLTTPWVEQNRLSVIAARWLNQLRALFPLMILKTVDYTPASVSANTCEENATTVSVEGARAGDVVEVTPPSISNDIAPVCARVSADDTVSVTFCNPTGTGAAPASGDYVFKVTRP